MQSPDSPLSLRATTAQAVAWSAVRTWGERGISFLVFLALVRVVEPEAFGLVALAMVFVGFVENLLDQGFGDAIVQRAELEPAHLDTAFWVGMGLAAVLLLVGLSVSGPMAGALAEPRLAPIIRWLSVRFILRALSNTQRDLLRRRLAFKRLAVRSAVAAGAGGAVGVTLAWQGAGAWSLVGQSLTYGGVEVLVLWVVSDWRPGLRVSRRHFRDLFGFSVHILAARSVSGVGERAADLMIGAVLGPLALGYYTVAVRLLRVLIALLTAVVGAVAFPVLAQLQRTPARLRQAFYKLTQLTSLVSIPAFLGLSALAPEFVPVLFGSEWTPSVTAIQLLALLGVVESATYFNNAVFKATGSPVWQFRFKLGTAVASVCAGLVVVRWGIGAVAGAYALVGYAMVPLALLGVRRLIAIDASTYLRLYAVPLGGSLAMVAAITGARYVVPGYVPVEVQLGLYASLGAMVYLGFVRLAGPELLRECLELVRLMASTKTLKTA